MDLNKDGCYGFFVGFGEGLPGFIPLRLFGGMGFFVGFGFGFGFGLGLGVGLGFGFAMRLVDVVNLAIGLTDLVDFVALVVVFANFGAFAAMAEPVIRKAAAVIDASSFFKVCSSFP